MSVTEKVEKIQNESEDQEIEKIQNESEDQEIENIPNELTDQEVGNIRNELTGQEIENTQNELIEQEVGKNRNELPELEVEKIKNESSGQEIKQIQNDLIESEFENIQNELTSQEVQNAGTHFKTRKIIYIIALVMGIIFISTVTLLLVGHFKLDWFTDTDGKYSLDIKIKRSEGTLLSIVSEVTISKGSFQKSYNISGGEIVCYAIAKALWEEIWNEEVTIFKGWSTSKYC